MFGVIGTVGAVCCVLALVGTTVLLWDTLTGPAVSKGDDVNKGESWDDVIALCTLEYAYTL